MNKYEKNHFTKQRNTMVYNQIVARGIKDKKLIEAMLNIPRHRFIPEKYRDFSYLDSAVPIRFGQTISQPYIVALMTELLDLKGGEKVLEIGTGSGYQAAILSEMGCEVYTVEIVEELARKAKKILESLGYDNILCKIGNGYEGWKEYATFDAIIVTAAPREIPKQLIEQLKLTGKMVMPVGEDHQELQLITKTKDDIKIENITPVQFVPMTGKKYVEVD